MSTPRDRTTRPTLPIAPPPPQREPQPGESERGPDLHLEEVEEKHLPKDRNIFDK